MSGATQPSEGSPGPEAARRAVRISPPPHGGAGDERLLEQVPPQNLDAEMAVLGSMLLERDAISSVVQHLKPDDFYVPAHRAVYEAAVGLYDQNRPVDVLTVCEELRRRGDLEEVGGEACVAGLADSTPSAISAEYYADLVRDKSLLREMIRAAEEIRREALADRQDAGELLDQCEKRVFEVTLRRQTGQTVTLKEVLKETFARIDQAHEREGRLTGLSTGFYALDDLTLGFQPGEMIVLAARPSMGKSSLALNIAEHVGVELGKPVLFFSLEMSKQQIAQNMLCSRSRVNGQLLRKGMLSERHLAELSLAAGALGEAPIFIDDTPGLTPLQIRAKARRHKLHQDVALIVVDYLQLIDVPAPSRSTTREQQVASMSRSLKALARELEVPVLAVSQLNRAPEAREDHRPRMSDLRESGAIEQDADVVMMLHRDDAYDPEANRGEAALNVVKQRNGPTGPVRLVFLHEYMRFENAASGVEGQRDG